MEYRRAGDKGDAPESQPSVLAVSPRQTVVLQIGGELESNGDGLQGMAERGAGEELGGLKVMEVAQKVTGLCFNMCLPPLYSHIVYFSVQGLVCF